MVASKLVAKHTPRRLHVIPSISPSLGDPTQVVLNLVKALRSTGAEAEIADLFVLPSLSENFSIAAAEAMAAGKPVIVTTDVQIAPEIIAANAGLVVQGEVSILAEAIYKLLTAPSLRQELGSNGKNLASSRYCWNTVAKNLTSVYGAIINNSDVTIATQTYAQA